MKLIQIISISFLTILVYMSCTTAEARQNPDVNAVVKGNTAFALDIYKKLKHTKGNLFFSPYSISAALAMTYAGARQNTAEQMAETLHFTLDPDRLHPAFALIQDHLNGIQKKGNIQLSVANTLWPQKGYNFLQDFLDLTKKYYRVSVTPADYKKPEPARKIINTWVEEKTNNKIRELIQKNILDPFTTLVLVNAIYFKGNWSSQFNKELTTNTPFWLSPDKSVRIPMMAQKKKFLYAETRDLQILELPYVGNDLSMIVLLPKKISSLSELEKNLTANNMNKWTNSLRTREVQVFLPKFRLTSQFRLEKILKSMGMADAFGGSADFSGMTGNRDLFISAVIHKAFTDVSEEGTEAAAATAVIMSRGIAGPEPPAVFRADHPFVFLIRDNASGSILFLGRVENPSS